MKKQFYILVVITTCFVTLGFAQRASYQIKNGFALTGGLTQFDIITDNFKTKSANGFLGGLAAEVDIPNKWYNISFGMQLSENHLEVSARPALISNEESNIEYKLFAAQVAMLMHIKIVPYHFTIDVGPMLQYNGKLELKDENQSGYYINNYTNLMAEDISNISQFHFNGAVGASAGIKNFKLKAQYIYGFTNMLKKLDKKGLDTLGGKANFEGHQSMLVLGAMVSF
ncbi:hypothetical protein KFZ70_05300 [Tamlana fucoidanivorans]|uniref:Uncharacterized protein n=1 Tax=Allotamlana fucoidanivorans TaxID=2583814 RepID=A0A5C4STG8_9FLAO|nr:outer membrane beta-barrel protein [Tamlana fucoidanivorans]TNJ47069.1 hypothetical protein FGF67_00675 [Tamlana fucoidanivorans]